MNQFAAGIIEAFKLIFSLDPYLMEIVILSLTVSGMAVIISTMIGVPLGTYLGMRPEEKTGFISRILYTLMGMPPVVAGLLIYMLIARRGPLGPLGILYTPTAMVVVQVFLALPIVVGLTMLAIRSQGKEVEETALTLGAAPILTAWTVIRESKVSLLGAIVTGFGRIIAEVGAVMIVGGNIQGHTRVMTTAIVLETSKGNFELAIGLGIILLTIFFIINSVMYRFQKGGGRHPW
ncbi:ABC transporter permease [Candidatus Contubernalis alkaliaceticus]|uniref:ABC transporter permease n=1 Tax=Candidatus Contubernalis alkaliaceticus TaxID=338645 RepID=UPI001F4BFDD2|nr:ABC transporter permease [Candidatus Contubernalis alkalaceticus]